MTNMTGSNSSQRFDTKLDFLRLIPPEFYSMQDIPFFRTYLLVIAVFDLSLYIVFSIVTNQPVNKSNILHIYAVAFRRFIVKKIRRLSSFSRIFGIRIIILNNKVPLKKCLIFEKIPFSFFFNIFDWYAIT